ncbi:GGDEF domain-containing protein [Bosea sp. NBC_00550]|uniref:GGDEF domain-containing protein n=1 Tax=Bosea sp. NBC_00550 TaxID=2969621 RepID=UPI00222F6D1B|nr:GGDEF domain-containing protein [Bosea sp. NBC_00550]UZF95730.1 GGDEF domain-containing protein [Bosea sp. NBC_00550]
MAASPNKITKGYAQERTAGVKIWCGALAGCVVAIAVAYGAAATFKMSSPNWLLLALGTVTGITLACAMRAVFRSPVRIDTTGNVAAQNESAPEGSQGKIVSRFDERRRTQEEATTSRLEAERLQDIDPVTGLGNRHGLQVRTMQEFNRADREGTALSLLLLEVDGDDTLAASWRADVAGALQLHIADTLRSFVRPYDVVARISPSEFGVLLLGATGPTAASIARRLKNAVMAQPPLLLGGDMPVIRIFAVEREPKEKSFDEILTRARSTPISDRELI